jgi:hypothetical protein
VYFLGLSCSPGQSQLDARSPIQAEYQRPGLSRRVDITYTSQASIQCLNRLRHSIGICRQLHAKVFRFHIERFSVSWPIVRPSAPQAPGVSTQNRPLIKTLLPLSSKRMSAATTAAPAVVRSSSRRQAAYNSPTSDRHQRTPSSSARTPGDSYRSDSHTNSHTRAPSGPQAALARVAQHDYENTNPARPTSTRRSSSRDGAYTTSAPTDRTEPSRSTHRGNSRPGHNRYSVDMSGPQSGSGTVSAATRGPAEGAHPSAALPSVKRRTTIATKTGEWSLGKTIGAGSMGKVKLAKNLETGEQVCVLRTRGIVDERSHHLVRHQDSSPAIYR